MAVHLEVILANAMAQAVAACGREIEDKAAGHTAALEHARAREAAADAPTRDSLRTQHAVLQLRLACCAEQAQRATDEAGCQRRR